MKRPSRSTPTYYPARGGPLRGAVRWMRSRATATRYAIRIPVLAAVTAAVVVTIAPAPASASGAVETTKSDFTAARTTYVKWGTRVSRDWIFNNTKYLDCTYAHERVTVCIRFDRRTMYVKTNKADGKYKVGEARRARYWGTQVAYYRCFNQYRMSSSIWVGCHWDWPNSHWWCYTAKGGWVAPGGTSITWAHASYSMPRRCYADN